MTYPYDEVMDDFFTRHNLPTLELTRGQWDDFEETMEACQSEISEQRSYTRPSFADMLEINESPKIKALEAEIRQLKHVGDIYEKRIMRDHNFHQRSDFYINSMDEIVRSR